MAVNLRPFLISLLLPTFIQAPVCATDQGPRDSTSAPAATTRPLQDGPPAALNPIPGPLPNERKLPVKAPEAISADQSAKEMSAGERERRIQEIQQELESKTLKRKQRAALKEELRQLKIKALVTPEPAR
jgi:hypothetical protein